LRHPNGLAANVRYLLLRQIDSRKPTTAVREDYRWAGGDGRFGMQAPCYSTTSSLFIEPEDLLSSNGDAPQGAEFDGTEENATTTILLFRAVSHAEFSDVTTCGIFRQGPNS
jgi:hypothetical protein